MLLLNVMIMLQCCLVPYALLFVAFGSRCFYSSLVCLAKCVNVGGEEYKPRQVETKWEQRMEKIDIFKGFHFNSSRLPFFSCMCIKIRNFQVTLNCLMSHIQFSFMCIHVFNVLFHPLNFHHHHPLRSFLVLRSETNENAIFSLWNFFCCCCCLRSVPESLSKKRMKIFQREWKCQNRLKVHRGWLWGC